MLLRFRRLRTRSRHLQVSFFHPQLSLIFARRDGLRRDSSHPISLLSIASCDLVASPPPPELTCPPPPFLSRSNPRSNSIVQEYALPDFTSTFKTGYIKRGPNAEISPRAIAAAAALGAKNKSSSSTPASPPPSDTPVAMVVEEDDDQILPLGNERFSVPEVLFSPTDIGELLASARLSSASRAPSLDIGRYLLFSFLSLTLPFPCSPAFYLGLPQAGIPETIAQSIALLPEDLQGMFWSSIGIFGGSTLFPGFKERL